MSDLHRPEDVPGRLTALPGSLPYILAFAFALDGFWGDGDVLIALDIGRLGPSPEQRHGCRATVLLRCSAAMPAILRTRLTQFFDGSDASPLAELSLASNVRVRRIAIEEVQEGLQLLEAAI